MKEIKKKLEIREHQLQQWKKEKEKALQKVPEGYLRICKRGDKTQYYYRNDPKDFSGVYIKEKDVGLAKRLAQKDYDKKVLKKKKKELKAIHKYLSFCPSKSAEQIYENLHVARQNIIMPIQDTEEDYIRKWQEKLYQGKEFDENAPEHYTIKGERVRSKSEVLIADLLSKEGIPYRYECPVGLKGVGKIYPDFTVLHVRERKELLWEHFGMMDDPAYAEKAVRKLATYEQNGIFVGEQLIVTYETRKNPINQKAIKGMIEHYLK